MKHDIAVRYFFMTNPIQMGEAGIEWCPTEDMVTGFMIKPLQGSTFTQFRDLIIMGAVSMKDMVRKPHGKVDCNGITSPQHECVGRIVRSRARMNFHFYDREIGTTNLWLRRSQSLLN